jgi:hypothetical protein
MKEKLLKLAGELSTLRWRPGKDVLVVLVSWVLVTASLYTATMVVGSAVGGGMPYFFIYAGLTATIFGIGLPLLWVVVVRKRPLKDLGITRERLGWSLGLQLLLAALVLPGGFSGLSMPAWEELIPLIGLALAIGFFEAIFWRGWVLMRLEEAFGFIPALVVGSALYAAYHIGYGMPLSEMVFLFFIGIMYAAAFRLTGSIFILWPVFQPFGQLITLVKEGLPLPLIAALGFLEALILMWVLVWLAGKYWKKRSRAG